MKKKLLNSMRVLLVAAALGVGASSAWAETSTVYERGISTDWSSADVTVWTNSVNTPTITSVGVGEDGYYKGLQYTTGNAGGSVKTTISPTSGNIINLEANFFLKGGTGANATGQNYSYFRYGNIYVTSEAQSCDSYYTINEAPSTGNPGTQFHGTSAGSSSIYRTTGLSYRLVLEINTMTNVLTSMKIYVNGSTTATVDISDQALTSYDYTTLEFGYQKGRLTTNSTQRLEDINITQTTQAVSYANYTVHFVDGVGNKVKEDVVRNGQVGTTVNANSDDQTTFYSDGVIANNSTTDFAAATAKYTYTSDGDGVEVTGDGNAEFTVTYTKHEEFSVTASAVSGGSTIKENISSATAYEGETATINLQKYINVSGIWYTTTEDLYVNATVAGDTEVEYSASDISYFFEYEDLTVSRTYGDGYNGTDASNGRAITMYGAGYANTESTVAPGVYTISLNGFKWQDGYEDTYEIAYSTDKSNWIVVGYIVYPDGEGGIKTLAGTIIPAASYIRVRATMGSQTPRRHLDYLTLEKTADLPATENIIVTDAGMATYVSDYNLDFTSATTKAYKVSVASKGVATLTEVSKVPAKTPVLLYKAGGNGSGEAIPVITDAIDAVTGNDLMAGTGVAVATTDGEYTNMILNNIDSKIGFYFANGQTVATNRAYLHIATTLAPDAVGGSRMVMVFGDEATGIESVKSEEIKVKSEVFNLKGQRVSQPTKGLYIVNGKKVIMK